LLQVYSLLLTVTFKLHWNSDLAFYSLDSLGAANKEFAWSDKFCPFKLLCQEIKLTVLLVVLAQQQGYDIEELLQAT
jgi:hypothetical protein